MSKKEEKEEKIEKSVKIGKTVYTVKTFGSRLEAEETTYPLAGYGNCVVTTYIISLNYSKKWAKFMVKCFNNGYASRGHGMTEGWVDLEDYEEKAKARELFDAVKQKLLEAEDGTPEVKLVFDMVALYSKFNP
jgi:hypothetical protein